MTEKVLIFKLGYSETLDREISTTTSYGDILRTTVLLHVFKDAHITWLVDKMALPILKDIKEIDRILVLDPLTTLQLQAEHFDTIINLEKVPGLCALADSIKAWRRFGFRFDERTGQAQAYDGSQAALTMCSDIETKRTNKNNVQQLLFEMVGRTWNNEKYLFGYKPKSEEKFDIGFNYVVGSKWPTKGWPKPFWDTLEKLLAENSKTVSWQQGMDNMEDYFEWINSCRMLVTNDSFGLHLALCMNKKVVSLFGPTNPAEVYHYDQGEAITPETDCMLFPCHDQTCHHTSFCMENLPAQTVCDTVMRLWDQ